MYSKLVYKKPKLTFLTEQGFSFSCTKQLFKGGDVLAATPQDLNATCVKQQLKIRNHGTENLHFLQENCVGKPSDFICSVTWRHAF